MCVCAGHGGGRVPDCLGVLPRVLGVAGAALPDPRGLHHRPLLPLAGLHAAPGRLGHAVGPGEVPASPPAQQQVLRWRGLKLLVSLAVGVTSHEPPQPVAEKGSENLEKSQPHLRGSEIYTWLVLI